jgi:two-component system OmpR family sensor kinase
LFVAVPLREVSASLHRLLLAEIGVSLAALFVVGAIATWLVRLSLRPLDRMALTADEIAAGDLSRRVDNDSGRGEVGRLGHALNEMLHQIEAAFDARQRSEDELRRSEERLRRFVADASHELRTPLTSIRGHAELFRRGGNADPVALAQSMRRIESEAQRMGVLVDDLLLLARIDEGLPLAREPVDLARVAADAVADARAVHPERQVDLDADHVVVTGDDARLHQLVANLLANALIHTPSGTDVQVRVGTEGDDAVLCVADDGPGLSPEQAARVFERFYRADPSRSRANGGTGLGLSIVAAVAEAHGGRVSVDTAPGEGATFRVQLPKERVPQKV